MNRIRQLRVALGMKQSDLANQLNVKANTISNWENEKSYPDLDSLQKMASILDTSVDYLLGGSAPSKTAGIRADPANLLDDFTRAMQRESFGLTEADKALLLSMAQQLNHARRRDSDNET